MNTDNLTDFPVTENRATKTLKFLVERGGVVCREWRNYDIMTDSSRWFSYRGQFLVV